MRARFIVILAVLAVLAFASLFFAIAPDSSSSSSVLAVAPVPQERPDERRDTVSPSSAAAITPTIQLAAFPHFVQSEQWSVYEDTMWGFGLSYPSEWQTTVVITNATSSSLSVIRRRVAIIGSDSAKITVDVWQKAPESRLIPWLDVTQRKMLELGQIEVPSTPNAVIGGHDALVLSQKGDCTTPQIFFAYVDGSDRALLVRYVAGDKGQAISIYRAILAGITMSWSNEVTSIVPDEQKSSVIPEHVFTMYAPQGDCGWVPNSEGCCGYPQVPHWQCSRDVGTLAHRGNCTYWAAYKRPDIGLAVGSGNAGQWADNAFTAGMSVDGTPKVGDIMVIEGSPGHVAHVTGVNGAYVSVTEMKWCSSCPEGTNSYPSAGKQFIHGYGSGTTCPAPSGGAPRDNVTLNNRRVTFTWTPSDCQSLDIYTFRVANHPNIDSGPWFIDHAVSKDATSVTEDIPSQYEGQTLYWAIWPHNSSGYGSRGGAWTFRVDTSIPPPPPPLPSGNWSVEYFRNKELSDRCATATHDGTFVFKDWGDAAPASGCNSDNWSARFSRRVHLQAGCYNFAVEADDWGRFYVNSDLVVNKWDGASQHYESRCYGSEGDYDLKVEFADTLGGAKISAWWWGPGYDVPHETQDENQWYAEYWLNPDQWWDPMVKRNEGTGALNHNWGYDGPGWNMPSDNFSTRFKRRVYFECGTYQFGLSHDDGAKLWIDENLVLDRWGTTGSAPYQTALSQGYHWLQVDHREFGGAANISLDWSRLSGCAPPAPALLSPSNSASLAWDTNISFSWAVSSGATAYYVHLWNASGIDLNSGWVPGTQWQLGRLASGSYNWTVKASNDFGDSSPSTTWSFTVRDGPPNAPYNLQATAASKSQINLTWTDDSDNESGFRVYRAGSYLGETGAGVMTYQDVGLSCNTEYCYSVTAFNDVGESSTGSQTCATTLPCDVAPIADFDAWPLAGDAPLTISMHNISSGNYSSCFWEYGDGATGAVCDGYHDHTYSAAGPYTVRLTVTGPGGSNTKTRAGYINVTSPCYTLSRTHSGSGSDPVASLTNSPGCATSQYVAGEFIDLTASPASGWRVGSWSGTNADGGTSASNNLTMPAGDHIVGVNYTSHGHKLRFFESLKPEGQ